MSHWHRLINCCLVVAFSLGSDRGLPHPPPGFALPSKTYIGHRALVVSVPKVHDSRFTIHVDDFDDLMYFDDIKPRIQQRFSHRRNAIMILPLYFPDPSDTEIYGMIPSQVSSSPPNKNQCVTKVFQAGLCPW